MQGVDDTKLALQLSSVLSLLLSHSVSPQGTMQQWKHKQ